VVTRSAEAPDHRRAARATGRPWKHGRLGGAGGLCRM